MTLPQELHIHVHVHNEPDPRIDEVLNNLTTLIKQGEEMTIDVQGITDAVSAETSVSASAVALIQGVSKQISDLSAQVAQEPAVQSALNELVSNLNASTSALSEAVVANTPAAPPTP